MPPLLNKIIKLYKISSVNNQGFLRFKFLYKKSRLKPTPFTALYSIIMLSLTYNNTRTETNKVISPTLIDSFFKKPTAFEFILNNFNVNLLLTYYYTNNFKFLAHYNSYVNKFLKPHNLLNTNRKLIYFNLSKYLHNENVSQVLFQRKIGPDHVYIKKHKLFKYRKYIFFKNHSTYLINSKFYFNPRTTIQLKSIANIFTISQFHQITIDFFQFTESAHQFGAFQNFSLPSYPKTNLFNLGQIATYFNWEGSIISRFVDNFKKSNLFSKLQFYFYNKLLSTSNRFNNNLFVSNNNNSDAIWNYKNSFTYTKSLININRTDKLLKKFTNTSEYLINFNFNKFELSSFFFFNPIFFKCLIWKLNLDKSFNKINLVLSRSYNFLLQKIKPCSKNLKFYTNNLFYNEKFEYTFSKTLFKVFDHSKFGVRALFWHYQILLRFLEHCSGKRVYFRIHPFLQNSLAFNEKMQCLVWAQKVKYFRRVLGPRLFLNESLQIIYLSLKLHDPFLLSNWMASILKKISFWKSKTFLRYIKYVLKHFFWANFKKIQVYGVKFQLKGKISVAGNSRTRTSFHTVGSTSHSNFSNRILFNLNLFRTFTGVQGLKLWLVF